VCALLLSTQGGVSSHAVGAELNIGFLLSPAVSNTFDSRLLQDDFNLDLDRQGTQESIKGTVRVDRRFENVQVSTLDIVRASNSEVSLDELGVILPNRFVMEPSRREGNINVINPLPTHFQLPPVARPPVQSSFPEPLSLVMLGFGGLALLGWSRHKRKKLNVQGGAHSAI